MTLNNSFEKFECWTNPDPAKCQDLDTILHKNHKSLCWLTSQYPVVWGAKIPACVFKFSALCTPCQCHSLQGGGRDVRNIHCKPFSAEIAEEGLSLARKHRHLCAVVAKKYQSTCVPPHFVFFSPLLSLGCFPHGLSSRMCQKDL